MKQLTARQPAPDRPAERPLPGGRPSSSVHPTTLALGSGALPAVQAHTPTPANSPDAQVQHPFCSDYRAAILSRIIANTQCVLRRLAVLRRRGLQITSRTDHGTESRIFDFAHLMRRDRGRRGRHRWRQWRCGQLPAWPAAHATRSYARCRLVLGCAGVLTTYIVRNRNRLWPAMFLG